MATIDRKKVHTDRQTRREMEEKMRDLRSKVEGARNILHFDGKEDGYVYRLFNDSPGRIYKFMQLGWEPVDRNDVKMGQRFIESGEGTGSVASIQVGGGVQGVLMRIPQDIYDMIELIKNEDIDKEEASMYKRDQAKVRTAGDGIVGYGNYERDEELEKE